MVGLGLLRGVGGMHYALRSANLGHLIGTDSEIRKQIDAFRGRPAETSSDPLDLRRFVGSRPGLLTVRQEGYLLAPEGAVVVLAGTRLAGISTWEEAVKAASRFARDRNGLKVRAQVMGMPFTFENFRTVLDKTARSSVGEQTICLVSPEAAWTAAWVQEAHRRMKAPARTAAPLRVLFVADAKRAWNWVSDPDRQATLEEGGAGGRRVLELTAGPWNRVDVDLWIDSNTLGMPVDAVVAATGGWDMLVDRFARLPAHDRSAPSDKLTRILLASKSDNDPLGDIRLIAPVPGILNALAECQQARLDDEVVDAQTVASYVGGAHGEVERVLAWGELTGLISRGPHGLALCREISIGLRQPADPAT
jgi:uncharacterized membrane protein (UPF0127 family)